MMFQWLWIDGAWAAVMHGLGDDDLYECFPNGEWDWGL
jgi:hypothetical protein